MWLLKEYHEPAPTTTPRGGGPFFYGIVLLSSIVESEFTDNSLHYPIFNAPSYEEAKRLLDRFVAKYATEQPKLSAWAEETIPEGLTVFSLPEPMRKKLRTNNLEERLNRSIKARTRLISVFPNQASQLRLVSAIGMEIRDEWEAGMIYLNVKEL